MEIVWFTLVAIALYLFSNWLLERAEIARGQRYKHRSIIFFVLLAGLGFISFWAIRTFLAGS